jgi:hypothetical protein
VFFNTRYRMSIMPGDPAPRIAFSQELNPQSSLLKPDYSVFLTAENNAAGGGKRAWRHAAKKQPRMPQDVLGGFRVGKHGQEPAMPGKGIFEAGVIFQSRLQSAY